MTMTISRSSRYGSSARQRRCRPQRQARLPAGHSNLEERRLDRLFDLDVEVIESQPASMN